MNIDRHTWKTHPGPTTPEWGVDKRPLRSREVADDVWIVERQSLKTGIWYRVAGPLKSRADADRSRCALSPTCG